LENLGALGLKSRKQTDSRQERTRSPSNSTYFRKTQQMMAG